MLVKLGHPVRVARIRILLLKGNLGEKQEGLVDGIMAIKNEDMRDSLGVLKYNSFLSEDEKMKLLEGVSILDKDEQLLFLEYIIRIPQPVRETIMGRMKSLGEAERRVFLRVFIRKEALIHVKDTDAELPVPFMVPLENLNPKVQGPHYGIYRRQFIQGHELDTLEYVPFGKRRLDVREQGLIHQYPLSQETYDYINGKMKRYTYPPSLLDLWRDGKVATRVIDLLPGTKCGKLKIKIRTISLEREIGTGMTPQYEALSYTWKETSHERLLPGLEEDSQKGWTTAIRATIELLDAVYCDGQCLPVSLGLRDALLSLRSPDLERTLWIDQLSINQDDKAERSVHVRFMDVVYNHATRVIVWTGEEDVDAKRVFELLDRFTGKDMASSPSKKPLENKLAGLPSLSSLSDQVEGDEYSSLFVFFQRPVFSRAWVIQEIVLGRRVIVKCGSREANFDLFSRFRSLYLKHPWLQEVMAIRQPRLQNVSSESRFGWSLLRT